MKKLFFALMAGGILFSATSCHKCGYCKDQYGQAGNNTSSVCQSASLIPGITSSYKQAQSDCSAHQGTWVVTN